MRMTVGPLPPAVYWRRRAIVLGGLVCSVALLFYGCAGARSAGSPELDAVGTSAGPTPTLQTPVTDEPPATASPSPDPAAGSGTPAGGQPTGPCTDAELTVAVAVEGNRVQLTSGSYVRIFLTIKNVSSRTCGRDVGPTQQEIRLMQGARTVWSSDHCATSTGSFIRTMAPGQELTEFNVTWNGRESTDCQNKPVPAPGAYQLSGRVGTKWSDPVALTLTK